MKNNTLAVLKKQRGAVLAIALLMLLVMTLLSVSAMESSHLNFKMSANSIYLDEAFNHSESVRRITAKVIDQYLSTGDMTGIEMPPGLANHHDNNSGNGREVNPLEIGSLEQKFSYRHLGVQGDVYLLKGNSRHNYHGGSAAQLKGYSGAGASAAGAGGVFTFYEIRSVGFGRAGSMSSTASDYRYVK